MPAAPLGIKLCEVGSLQLSDPLPPGQACMSPERWGEGLLAGAVEGSGHGQGSLQTPQVPGLDPKAGPEAALPEAKPEASASWLMSAPKAVFRL